MIGNVRIVIGVVTLKIHMASLTVIAMVMDHHLVIVTQVTNVVIGNLTIVEII